jgi:hypothetical protein
MTVEFRVEQAGCASCGSLIREALGEIGRVEYVDVDEVADLAAVRLVPSGEPSADDVDRILRRVSEESGHAYRVQPGSWLLVIA